jgi:aldehyde dehydrogenase (NAD+)
MNDHQANESKYAAQVWPLLSNWGVKSPPPAVWIGNQARPGRGPQRNVTSPIDGGLLTVIREADASDLNEAADRAVQAFLHWRAVPAPIRGELVRRIGDEFRQHKQDLARLITIENGKITSEALGEVQEVIDICDFATGLSRQLYGLTIASERPGHRLSEQWHPLGVIAVISAFNFPVAVWSWNAMIALVCGNSVLWKPSEKTPLVAIAAHTLAMRAVQSMPEAPADLLQLVIGGANLGKAIAVDSRFPVVSATGSVAMGRSVAQTVAARLGRTILELGGNNAAIVTESADKALAKRAIVFSAVGTCGQRCTSLRRLLVPGETRAWWRDQILEAFAKLPIGDPLDERTLVGPLIDRAALSAMQDALRQAREQGGKIFGGEILDAKVPAGGAYVRPALVEINSSAAIVQQETFAPILYLLNYRTLDEAIVIQNSVPQGLSSCIFTRDANEAELFCSALGSDCGIANVNVGTSGAEIGGAFGGEKDTGGGRESGSDAWKGYMRRATNTVNYSGQLPLAQGIRFEI